MSRHVLEFRLTILKITEDTAIYVTYIILRMVKKTSKRSISSVQNGFTLNGGVQHRNYWKQLNDGLKDPGKCVER